MTGLLGQLFAILLALALAPLIGALTLVVLAGAVLAWQRRYWSAGERVYYTLLALAALAFSIALGASGLLTALVA